MERKDLRSLSREDLLRLAAEIGIARPHALTTPELLAAVEAKEAPERTSGGRKPKGWFSKARDLLTSVLETGFPPPSGQKSSPPPARVSVAPAMPVPTVTLAEIYAAQGHFERAIATLTEVLAKEPDHAEAARLKQRFGEQLTKTRPSAPPPPSDTRGADKVVAGNDLILPPLPTIEAGGASLLPDRYEVDEVVGLAVDARTVYAYWEVRPLTLADVRARAPEGALTLRVLAVTSVAGGPLSSVRDERVDALFGEMYIHDVPPGANVRLTIGWKTPSGELTPLAVALELATPHAEPARRVAERTARWTKDVPLFEDDAALGDGFTAPMRFGARAGTGTFFRAGSETSVNTTGDASILAQHEDRPGEDAPPRSRAIRSTRLGSSDLFRKEMRFGASDLLRARALP